MFVRETLKTASFDLHIITPLFSAKTFLTLGAFCTRDTKSAHSLEGNRADRTKIVRGEHICRDVALYK